MRRPRLSAEMRKPTLCCAKIIASRSGFRQCNLKYSSRALLSAIGAPIAPPGAGGFDMRRYLGTFLLTTVLALPVATLLRADDDHDDHERKEHRVKRYYDDDAKDYHEWNEREDKAWRRYWVDRHEDYRDWERAKREERREYWR